METFIVRDSEQDLQGNISHICTAKASLDGTIHWMVLHIIQDTFQTALEIGDANLKRRKVSDLERIAMGVLDGLDVGLEIRRCTIQEHLKWLSSEISKSSYKLPLLGHALDRDIEFMYATDLASRSESKFFDGHPLRFPGNQRKSWQKINKVCTQRLLTSCCPITFELVNPGAKFGTVTLSHLTYALLHRVQKHNAVSDVLDLIAVLSKAHSLDQFKLPKENFLIIKPDNSVKIQAGTA